MHSPQTVQCHASGVWQLGRVVILRDCRVTVMLQWVKGVEDRHCVGVAGDEKVIVGILLRDMGYAIGTMSLRGM